LSLCAHGNARFRLKTPGQRPGGPKAIPITSFSGGYPMKKQLLLTLVVAFGVPLVCQAQSENPDGPTVFQAAGPDASSIQGTVDAFRAALGDPNNANNPGPLLEGRREINWDGGGGVDTATAPVTPFTFSRTPAARGSPRREQASPRRLHLVDPKAALQSSSRIRPMAPSSAPSARCGCSLRWAATLLKPCSLYPA
jgi:hypothetical protein